MKRYGTLEKAGDGWRLTYERDLPHSPAKVWRALTEAEHLGAWFPAAIEGEWTEGAELRFVFAMEQAPLLTGTVLTVDPPNVLEYTWDEDRLRFAIRPTDASCHLVFEVVFTEQGKAARDGAGWHACLDALEAGLDGRSTGEILETRWQEVHPTYVETFGPEAATVGPPDWAS